MTPAWPAIEFRVVRDGLVTGTPPGEDESRMVNLFQEDRVAVGAFTLIRGEKAGCLIIGDQFTGSRLTDGEAEALLGPLARRGLENFAAREGA